MTYMWEESFLSDDSELRLDGALLGKVSPVGGSWQVTYGAEMIAMRPDKASAQATLTKYHLAKSAEARQLEGKPK